MNTADRSVEALDTALRRRFDFKEMKPEPTVISPYCLLQRLWMKHWMAEEDSKTWEMWELEEENFIEFSGMKTDENRYEALARKFEKEGKEAEWMASDAEELFAGAVEFKNGVDLSELLSKINERLSLLISKDSTIGHAWFMTVFSIEELRQVFKNKILPLLQEFFYNDYAKIGLVLGEAFVKTTKVETGLFAKFNDADDLPGQYADKVMYTLVDPMEISLEGFRSIYVNE